jgi:hypothetical protein
MRKVNLILIILLFTSVIVSTGCSGSKQCGCPSKKGMVGY